MHRGGPSGSSERRPWPRRPHGLRGVAGAAGGGPQQISSPLSARVRRALHRYSRQTGTSGVCKDLDPRSLPRAEGWPHARHGSCHTSTGKSDSERPACDAFQEVVGDLYDGFLSAEDRQGVNPPEDGSTPPLIKWGNPKSGPYTWPTDATSTFGARVPVVNLPPANAHKGVLAWAALGHETCGHDILHGDHGLQNQLASAVQAGVAHMGGQLGGHLASYWSSRMTRQHPA